MELKELEKTYLIAFTSPAGAVVLEDLEKAYGARKSHTEGDPYETAFREGERSALLRIKHLMKQARLVGKGKKKKEVVA